MATDSFNEDFCSYLEYHLCRTFQNSNEKNFQGIWCDGISHEVSAQSKKDINKTRKLVTTAWLGYDGQDKYEMTVNLGNTAFEKYKKGLNLDECVPSEDSMEWIKIDKDKHTIELQLK